MEHDPFDQQQDPYGTPEVSPAGEDASFEDPSADPAGEYAPAEEPTVMWSPVPGAMAGGDTVRVEPGSFRMHEQSVPSFQDMPEEEIAYFDPERSDRRYFPENEPPEGAEALPPMPFGDIEDSLALGDVSDEPYYPGDGYDDGTGGLDQPRKRTVFKKRLRKPNFVLTVIVNSLRVLLLLVLVAGLALCGTVVGIAKGYMDSAPDLDLAALTDQAQTSFVYDRSGVLICEYMGTENRVMVPFSSMPQYLRDAFVAVEDARFYSHNGVDIKRILGAFYLNFTTGSNQGGSTITQQLIKNTLLSSEQSYKRKIQEAYLAMQLETKYTKDQILECYLNTIYLGENYYGVQVAAYGYFGKSDLSTLTLRECAMLAGMTRNPTYYNCRRNLYTRKSDTTDYIAITNNRTDYALKCMYENGFITREEYESALDPSAACVLAESPENQKLYDYPHYVEYAMSEAVQLLLKKNGLENTSANRVRMESELRTGGYHIYLAIDRTVQEQLEDTVYNWKDYPDLRDPADRVFRARNSDGTSDEIVQPQAAAVIMDYRNGQILGMVGSRTAPEGRKTLNRAVNMNMPVGSSIKPIAVYAPAIELGQSPASVTYNMPLPIAGWKNDQGQDSWPVNYGGSDYRGPETLRTALIHSDNTAAAWTEMNYVTVDNSTAFLRMMGVSESHINATPFGVSLGSSGLTPLEMAACYSALGNGGVYLSPVSVLRITRVDSAGNEQSVAEYSDYQTRTRVFSESTAWLTVDMMKDAVKSGTGTSAKISGQTVAGKTGTNSDQKGVTFSGLTGYYCSSVWIGSDNYKSLSSRTTGGTSAAKLWQTYMKKLHTGLANRDIISADPSSLGLVRVETCAVSGLLATDACRNDACGYGTVTDWWKSGTQPTQYCSMHLSATVCDESGALATASCPSSSQGGILVIPAGHPLSQYIGTQYEGVLTDYLGEYASLRLTGNSAADQAAIAMRSCTLHTGFVSRAVGTASAETLRDARSLESLALKQKALMSGTEYGYDELCMALDTLQTVLSSSPDDDRLYDAMARLSRALASVY